MNQSVSMVDTLRDAFSGPAARTTIILGLIAAALAFATPVVVSHSAEPAKDAQVTVVK